MATTVTDRLFGENSSVAVKAPVVAVTTSNVSLSSLAAIPTTGGSYVPSSGDRILVPAQTDTTQNGIYNANSSTWTRAGDFDGTNDAVQGTIVTALLAGGASAAFYQLTTASPVIGTTALNFSAVASNNPNISYPQTQAEINASVTVVNGAFPVGYVDRYGTNTVPGTTDMRAAIRAAWLVCKQQGGGVVTFLDGFTYAVSSLDPASPINLPQQNSDGSVTTSPYQVALYLVGGTDIDFDFRGATIHTTITGGGVFFLFDNCTNIRMCGPRITGLQVQSTGVVTLGPITGGTGYTAGTYSNVLLTGGSGGGAAAQITVSGGAVTSCVLAYPGGSYAVNDVLSANAADIGGTGTGFSVPVTSISGAGPVVATAAPNAITVCALSGSSANITIRDLYTNGMYTGFWCVANPNQANTVTQVALVGTTRVLNGEYGIALHNTGDFCTIENAYTYRVNRPFFFYGVQDVRANIIGDQVNHGFQPVLKAYSRIIRNVSLRYASINQPGQSNVVARISLQVQCDPAVINPAPYLDNIFIEYDEQNVFAASGNGIEFDYFAGAGGTTQQTSTTNLIFQNIHIKGWSGNCLLTTVTLTATTNQCPIYIDEFTFPQPAAANDVRANGFVSSAKFTYAPTIQFGGGAATGWVFSTNQAEYYLANGMCHVFGRLTVSTKGSKVGALTISMPYNQRLDAVRNPLFSAMGLAGMVGLSGPITGFISTSSPAVANPQVQGATAASAVSDANMSATSDILWEAIYPI